MLAKPGLAGAAALIASLAAGSCAAACDDAHAVELKDGDGAVDGSILRPYDNAWSVTFHGHDGRNVDRGVSSDHVRFLDIGGRRYLSRIEASSDVDPSPGEGAPTGEVSATFNVFDPLTLSPLIGEARASDGSQRRRRFDGARVVTTSQSGPKAAPEVVETTLPRPVLDMLGGMTGLVLASLPLKAGYCVAIPAIAGDGLRTGLVHVIGRRAIRAGAHRVMAWEIEVGRSPAATTYWVTKAAPYVIRVDIRAPDGVTRWEMIDQAGRAPSTS